MCIYFIVGFTILRIPIFHKYNIMYYHKDNRNLGNDFHGRKREIVLTPRIIVRKSYIMSHGESVYSAHIYL